MDAAWSLAEVKEATKNTARRILLDLSEVEERSRAQDWNGAVIVFKVVMIQLRRLAELVNHWMILYPKSEELPRIFSQTLKIFITTSLLIDAIQVNRQ